MSEELKPAFKLLLEHHAANPDMGFMSRVAYTVVIQSKLGDDYGCSISVAIESADSIAVKGRGWSYVQLLFDKFIEENVPTKMSAFAEGNLAALRDLYTRMHDQSPAEEEVGFFFGVDQGFATVELEMMSITLKFDILQDTAELEADDAAAK
jgi:hypothetical protein